MTPRQKTKRFKIQFQKKKTIIPHDVISFQLEILKYFNQTDKRYNQSFNAL